MLEAVHSEHRAVTKARERPSGEHGEGHLRDHPERRCYLGARGSRHGDTYDGPELDAGLAHRLDTEADLAVAVRELPIDRGEQQPPFERRCHDGSNGHLVDRDICCEALGEAGDGRVVLETGKQRWVGPPLPPERSEKFNLERVAVQPRRGREVRETGTENPGPAQGDHRQRRAEESAAHRDRATPAASFQGMACP